MSRSLPNDDVICIISSDSDSSVKLGKDDFEPPPVKKEKMNYLIEGGVDGPSGMEISAGPSGLGDITDTKVSDLRRAMV